MALNPNYSFAHDQFGMALAFQGRFAEAATEGGLAIELDPLSPRMLVDATIPLIFQRNAAPVLERRRWLAVHADPRGSCRRARQLLSTSESARRTLMNACRVTPSRRAS